MSLRSLSALECHLDPTKSQQRYCTANFELELDTFKSQGSKWEIYDGVGAAREDISVVRHQRLGDRHAQVKQIGFGNASTSTLYL